MANTVLSLSSITIGVLIGASFVGGIVLGLEWSEVFGVQEPSITKSPGLVLDDVIVAFGDENTKNRLGVKDILAFVKSGGTAEGGQNQTILRVDLPVETRAEGDVISLQYFVEVRDDMNKELALHCGDIRLSVYLDQKKVFVTDWLGYEDRYPQLPLKTEKITIHDVPVGLHSITLIPEARAGGCNAGHIQSWGGTAVIFN
jgi:hypothetical protein